MAVNLINMLQNEVSDDAIGKIASFVGETPANTQSALGYVIPAFVGALAQKSQTTPGAADLFGILQRGGFDGATFGSLGTLTKTASGASDALKTGAPLVSTLFGARRTGLTDWISATTGIRPQSAVSILSVVAPFVLNLVGREATATGGFNASALARLLGEQWGFLRNLAPAGLASVLGLGGWEEPARAYEVPRAEPARAYGQPVRTEPARDYDRPGGWGWLKWALPLLVLIPLLVWAFTGLRTREPGRDVTGTFGTAGLVKHRLSCGQELDVAPNGVESRLVAFIDDKTRSVDKEEWLTFDRLEFETASATLRPSSQAQLRNIAEILRCYPNVNLKFGGYTDNVGDPASNQRLSQARAENTRQGIIRQGIDGSRLEAEGYGEQHPVATNDTEEGRQRNRRIDVRVTRK
jgi:OmpA-OmpF porin, OOP family